MTSQRSNDSRESPDRNGRKRRPILAVVLGGACLIVVSLTVIIGLYTLTLIPDLPQLRDIRNPEIELATTIYAADGTEITRFYRKNRIWVTYDQIAPSLVDALVATEDHRFFDHHGVDLSRMISSAYKTARGNRQGGSTITMQLARNLYPEVGGSWPVARKLKEILTAFKIERHYDKREIIEMYLNTVPFGYNAFGVEAAARTYFARSAAALDLEQSATLIGMLKATSRYNPVRNPDLARARRNVVLAQMVRHGYIPQTTYAEIREKPIELIFEPPSPSSNIAPHFAEYVRGWLHEWAAGRGHDIYADGLKVYTTLDPAVQELANAAVEEQMKGLQAVVDFEWSRASDYFLGSDIKVYERYRDAGRFTPFSYFWNTQRDLVNAYIRDTDRYRNLLREGASPEQALNQLKDDPIFMDSLRTARTRLEVGLVAVDPVKAEVKPWVGGRDFTKDQYDKVALARRQPGSTFKPVVYTAAIDFGYSPYYTIQDTLTTFQLADSRQSWTPRNAGGGFSEEDVTLHDGLTFSKNTVTAHLVNLLGPHQIANYARRMGIKSELNRVLSIGLGTSEVTLLELVSVYNTLANYGTYREPVFVTRIEDQNGRVLYTAQPESRKAVSMQTAYTVLDILRGVVDHGTGSAIRWKYGLEGDLAGKTGTTQHNADGWFVLMHPRLITGAWVGFNDRRIAFRSSYWGQGAHNALNVVGDFYKRLVSHSLLPETRFIPPPGYREPMPPDSASSYYDAYHYDLLDDTLSTDAYVRRTGFSADSLDEPSFRTRDSLFWLEADVERALRISRDSLHAYPDKVSSEFDGTLDRSDRWERDLEEALRDRLREPAEKDVEPVDQVMKRLTGESLKPLDDEKDSTHIRPRPAP